MDIARDSFNRRLLWAALGIPIVWVSMWIGLHIYDFGVHILEDLPLSFNPVFGVDYAMGLLWWVILAVAILAVPGDTRKLLMHAWVGKLFVTLLFMLFYEWFYGLDSTGYYHFIRTGYHDWFPHHDFSGDLLLAIGSFGGDPLSNQGHSNWLRMLYMISMVTGPYYHALKVACAFLGLMGVLCFYRAAVVAFGRPCPALFYLLAFSPSMLFWSSTLGKDPVHFFFISLYAYGGALLLARGGAGPVALMGVALLGSYAIRPWVAIMQGGVFLLAMLLGRAKLWQVALLVGFGTPILYAAAGSFLESFISPDKFIKLMSGNALDEVLMEVLQERAKAFEGESKRLGGSGASEIEQIAQGGADLSMAPYIVFSGLFRPLPYDITNLMTALAAVENSLILVLSLIAVIRLRPSYLRDPFVLWPILYCVTWALLFGLIVIANFGAGARQKLQMWPFLLLPMICLIFEEGRRWLDARCERAK